MMFLYKIYSFCIAIPLFILDTAITAVVSSIGTLFPGGDKVYTSSTRLWGKFAFLVFLLPVKTKGMERLDPKQSYIFIANHQGYLDILLCYGYLGHSFKWMMKEYLKKMPIIGWACKNTHQIFVGDSRSSIQQAVVLSEKTLKDGMSMIIFPEGTRTYNGQMQEFKRGAFMLANDIELPIVPLTINGSFQFFNRKAKSMTWHPVELTMHHPISVEARQGKPTKEIMREVFDIINADLWKK